MRHLEAVERKNHLVHALYIQYQAQVSAESPTNAAVLCQAWILKFYKIFSLVLNDAAYGRDPGTHKPKTSGHQVADLLSLASRKQSV